MSSSLLNLVWIYRVFGIRCYRIVIIIEQVVGIIRCRFTVTIRHHRLTFTPTILMLNRCRSCCLSLRLIIHLLKRMHLCLRLYMHRLEFVVPLLQGPVSSGEKMKLRYSSSTIEPSFNANNNLLSHTQNY